MVGEEEERGEERGGAEPHLNEGGAWPHLHWLRSGLHWWKWGIAPPPLVHDG